MANNSTKPLLWAVWGWLFSWLLASTWLIRKSSVCLGYRCRWHLLVNKWALLPICVPVGHILTYAWRWPWGAFREVLFSPSKQSFEFCPELGQSRRALGARRKKKALKGEEGGQQMGLADFMALPRVDSGSEYELGICWLVHIVLSQKKGVWKVVVFLSCYSVE